MQTLFFTNLNIPNCFQYSQRRNYLYIYIYTVYLFELLTVNSERLWLTQKTPPVCYLGPGGVKQVVSLGFSLVALGFFFF